MHHFHEFVNTHRTGAYLQTLLTPRILVVAVVDSLVRFAYTSIFGFLCAFVFLRTGSFWACLIMHSFCNSMGLPRVYGRVGEVYVGDRRDDRASLGMAWTVAYYVLLVTGAVGFRYLLCPLTASGDALATW